MGLVKLRGPAAGLLALLLLWGLLAGPAVAVSEPGEPPRVIHVFVALCDNKHQGIVPVPARLGNGQNPQDNLYWGARYGVKTWFGKQDDWKLLQREKEPLPYILERLVFKQAGREVYLVADAYDGRFMRKCLEEFLLACAGSLPSSVWFESGEHMLLAGGKADLLVFVGHNGLMEIHDLVYPASASSRPRQAAVFACQSRFFFKGPLGKSGAQPLILTSGNLAPEAYSVEALVQAWLAGQSPAEIREAVAQAYHNYQKCGLRAARRLFVNQ